MAKDARQDSAREWEDQSVESRTANEALSSSSGGNEDLASSIGRPTADGAIVGEPPADASGVEEREQIECGLKVPSLIVAMGGSAGSLEAFQEFLRNVPEKTGMAFVVVSHLDPTRPDLMPEILP